MLCNEESETTWIFDLSKCAVKLTGVGGLLVWLKTPIDRYTNIYPRSSQSGYIQEQWDVHCIEFEYASEEIAWVSITGRDLQQTPAQCETR